MTVLTIENVLRFIDAGAVLLAVDIVSRMVGFGMTRAQIGVALGHPEWRCAAFCDLNGIRSTKGRRLPSWSVLEVELATARRRDVAAKYGVSTSAISQARRKARAAAEA